jgi:DNA-binding transcriptional LysR family regulator
MRKHPPFAALRAFEAAARLQSFAAAAEELRLTPSAVSHQIRQLEVYFARPLFIRHSRQIEVTAKGERLQEKLSNAFNDIERACAEVSPPAESQDLSVHSSPSFASKWLAPRLPEFFVKEPSININLSSGNAPIDLLRHEELDVLIVYGNAVRRAGIVVEPLSAERIAPMISTRLLQGRDSPLLSQMGHIPLIDSQVSPVTWPAWFTLHGLDIDTTKRRPSFDRGALVISAALDGLGVALETTRFAQQELAAGELVILEGEGFQDVHKEMHFLCYRAADAQSGKLVRFREWLLGLEAELQ